MLPDSSFPGTPSPSPRKRLPSLRRGLIVLAVVLIIAGFVGAFQALHGAGSAPSQAHGPAATATTAMPTTTADEASADATTTPGPTPPPTTTSSSPSQQTGAIRVTKNQDMRVSCTGDNAPYTVALYNAGNVAANWHVNVPEFMGVAPGGPGSRPLSSPLSTYPYWANVSPQDGSIAPGQSVSFVMSPVWSIPCGGTLYRASVQLHFPSGASQADIPLTYGGTGPAPYSNVVLASGSMTGTETCPTDGSAPAPFTFAITNTGTAPVDPGINEKLANGSSSWWANLNITKDPAQEVTPTLLYPGQIWTVTVSPIAGVSCNGTSYYVYTQTRNVQGGVTTLTFTYTFTAS